MVDTSNPYGNLGTVSPEIYQQQQDLNRQQRMAEMLMQNNQQPQGQMISGRYVAPSWAAQLAPVASMLTGAYMQNKGDEKALQLAKTIREQRMGVMENINNALKTGDTKTAMGIATANPEFAKDFIAPLISNAIPKTPDEVAKYNFAKTPEGGGFKGTFAEFQNQMTPYQRESLAIERQKLNNELNGSKATESQSKAGVFRSQMVGASNELNNLYANGFNPNNPVSQVTTNMAGGVFNALTPANAQQAKQAQNQWTEAYLRFKTGAGTNAHEVEANRKTYFPEFGDKPEQIAQKARMRAQAEHDIAIAAGPTARFGAQTTSPTAPPAVTTPANNQKATPSLWGKATVVENK